jgi:hypothetical protein
MPVNYDLGREIRVRHSDLPVILTLGYFSVLAEEASHDFELLQRLYAGEDLSRVLRAIVRRKAGNWPRVRERPP